MQDIPISVRCQRYEGAQKIEFENESSNLYLYRRGHKQVEVFARVDKLGIFKFRVKFTGTDSFSGFAQIRVIKIFEDKEITVGTYDAADYINFQLFYNEYTKDCPVGTPLPPPEDEEIPILDGGLNDPLSNFAIIDGGFNDALSNYPIIDGN